MSAGRGCLGAQWPLDAAACAWCRLEGFDGDMLGKTLRAFGSMRYYDDDLLEGESYTDSYFSHHPPSYCHNCSFDVSQVWLHAFGLSLCQLYVALAQGDT
jgi:hypothetical protein